MAKIRIEQALDGKSPDDCFEAAKIAFPNAGFEIFKIREIAWLVIAQLKESNNLIEASIGARPPAICAHVTLTISCNDFDKSILQEHADNIMSEFEKVLEK